MSQTYNSKRGYKININPINPKSQKNLESYSQRRLFPDMQQQTFTWVDTYIEREVLSEILTQYGRLSTIAQNRSL